MWSQQNGSFNRQNNNNGGGYNGRYQNNGKQQKVYYPDEKQIFVGNLRHQVEKSEIQQHFHEYEPIIEVRLIDNQHNGQPNCAFVVFQSEQQVQDVLSNKGALTMMGENRINIGEKTSRYGKKRWQNRENPQHDNNRRGYHGNQQRYPATVATDNQES